MTTLIDTHTHNIRSGNIYSIYYIRINNESVSLPHGPNVFFSAGIHPWDTGDIRSTWMENMGILLRFDQVIAVGECGLDKHAPVSLEKQLEIFELHIKLAEMNLLPMIIHCVGYFNELIKLHQARQPKQPWIIHGFRGKPELARQLIQAGFYLSYGEKFNSDSVLATPCERILIETDESSMPIESIYESISAIKNCLPEELHAANQIFKL